MNGFKLLVCTLGFSFSLLAVWPVTPLAAAPIPEIPVKGMVTMIDLGARTCIPCKMMAPILVKLEKKYAGKAAVIFLDIDEHPELKKRFGLSAIPTQIFFDEKGRGVLRHRGFMSEEAIVKQFEEMGIK
jgi:thioredoxin 1